MQNFDELAEGYLGLVEKQKVSEGKAVDSFSRGDMETCFVSGAQSMEQLQEGCEGTFGQAVGSLKHGFLVRRKGWNGCSPRTGCWWTPTSKPAHRHRPRRAVTALRGIGERTTNFTN